MGFSAKQLQALRRSLNRRHIRTREAHGRELSYIEGWYAISEANRIFGFDGWNRETMDSRCVLARENRGSFLAVYVAKVRITVQADGATIVRDGHGSGKAVAPPLVTFTTLLSKPPKPMPPNGRSPRSANRLGLSFIARTRAHRCKLCRRTSGPPQVHPRSPVWAHTLTIRHRSRGHRIIMGGGTRTR